MTTPRRTRPLTRALLGAASLALITAPAAQAIAGGGSSHFSGGGGGGGGGFGGGGFGGGGYSGGGGNSSGSAVWLVAIMAAVLLYLLVTKVIPWLSSLIAGWRTRTPLAQHRISRRAGRVQTASAEAAEDDAAFDAEHVRTSAARLFLEIQSAWSAQDQRRLGSLVGRDLMVEWRRRLDDFDFKRWHNRVEVLEGPTVEYVGLQNRSEDAADRVVVLIDARVRDYVVDRHGSVIKRTGQLTDVVHVREFWTLAKSTESRDGWILSSIEQASEGMHNLHEQIVATPWADEQSLRDEALVEHAVADALPADINPAEVADLDFDGDARAAALDLSLADGRFAPDVLEVAARHAVAAWAEAVDGDDRALETLASPEVVTELLHPGDPSMRTRLVIRGPKVKQIRIAAVNAAAEPPTMTIDVDLEGRRYIERRDTAAVIDGSQSRVTSFSEHWTLALDGAAEHPWRIASIAGSSPARA